MIAIMSTTGHVKLIIQIVVFHLLITEHCDALKCYVETSPNGTAAGNCDTEYCMSLLNKDGYTGYVACADSIHVRLCSHIGNACTPPYADNEIWPSGKTCCCNTSLCNAPITTPRIVIPSAVSKVANRRLLQQQTRSTTLLFLCYVCIMKITFYPFASFSS